MTKLLVLMIRFVAWQTLTALAEELDTPFLEGNVRRCELFAMLGEWDAAKQMCSSVIDSPVSVWSRRFTKISGLLYVDEALKFTCDVCV